VSKLVTALPCHGSLDGFDPRTDRMNIVKGVKIRAQWFQANDPPSSLAGMQMKLGVTSREVVGTVTHIYGYATSRAELEKGNTLRMTVMVKPDDGGEEVEVDQKHIVELL
jgi:hypothetical protein